MSPEEISAAIREYVAANGMSQPLKDLEHSVDRAFSSDLNPWSSTYGI